MTCLYSTENYDIADLQFGFCFVWNAEYSRTSTASMSFRHHRLSCSRRFRKFATELMTWKEGEKGWSDRPAQERSYESLITDESTKHNH
jgi:hypothetical protein